MKISGFFLFLFLSVQIVSAQQVGINTNDPNPLTVLDVTTVYDNNGDRVPGGIMVPRLTEAERDLIDVSDAGQANSLLIYNTDEDCFNFFSRTENMWKSVCGGNSSVATVAEADCESLVIEGDYAAGTALNSSNYLTIPVNVTKPGSYELSAISSPANGYFYTLSGTFLTTGIINLTVPGYGTPIMAQTDSVIVTINGNAYCGRNVEVTSSIITPVYDISCSDIVVQGDYVAARALSPTNNTILVTLTADASAFGSVYRLETEPVNGYYFYAEGVISQSSQIVVLNGSGTPDTSGIDTFNIISNSGGTLGVPTGCEFEVKVATRTMNIVGVGENATYYPGATTNGMYRVLNNPNLFGLSQDAIFPVAGINIITSGTGPGNDINLANVINTYNPDIIIVQYNWIGGAYGASNLDALTNYVEDGGVLILCSDGDGAASVRNVRCQTLVNSIFDTTEMTPTGNIGQDVQPFPEEGESDAPVLAGPFRELYGLNMSRDAGNNFNFVVSTLPDNADIIAYNNATKTDARAFMHHTKGFLFIGDGGLFAYAPGNTEPYNYPMKLDVNYNPIPNIYSDPISYNADLFCNIMAWAFQYVQTKRPTR